MYKILGFSLILAVTLGIVACGDSSSSSGPDSNNVSCNVEVHGDTVVSTQRSTTGKTVKTIAIVGDSITESTRNYYYDDDIKHIFLDDCEDSDLQKCGKDNITILSAPKPKGKETIETIVKTEKKACDAYLSAKMAKN